MAEAASTAADVDKEKSLVRCGVIGVGRMGQHHARIYSRMYDNNVKLAGIYDQDPDRAKKIADEYHTIAASSLSDFINLDLDAVTVAVPTVFHLETARPLLKAGIACLIEKPLAPNVDEAQMIADLARETGTILQVGHIERYNPAVRALAKHKDLVPRFIEVHRVSPMSFRSVDVGVVLDMMIHDLDVLLMLAGGEPVSIQAAAVSVLGAAEDVCNARLEFANGCVANVTASRLAMKTERKIRIIAEDAYVSIDFAKKNGLILRRTANAEQLEAIRSELAEGTDLSDLDYTQLVNIEPLDIDDEDQLQMQLCDFINVVRTGGTPMVDVHAGFAAVRTAERIVNAAREHARKVNLTI